MGLDNFASRTALEVDLTPGDIAAFEAANIHLTQGVFSLDFGGFRGKVYATLVLDITGYSLYDCWLPPAAVREMYVGLMQCEPAALLETYRQIVFENGRDECRENLEDLTRDIVELRKFFQVCCECGLGLIGDS